MSPRLRADGRIAATFARLRAATDAGARDLRHGRRSRPAAHGRASCGARSRRRRRARGRRAVLRSAGRRPGDPARDRARAGVGHDAGAACSICSAACAAGVAGADRHLQLREPDPAAGRGAVRRPGPGGGRGRRARPRPADRGGRRVPEHAGVAGIDTILLLSPTTTDERLRKAAALGSGFLYAISRLGVTGARDRIADGAQEMVQRIRASATCRWRSASASRSPSTCAKSAGGRTPRWSAARSSASLPTRASADLNGRVEEYVRWLKS